MNNRSSSITGKNQHLEDFSIQKFLNDSDSQDLNHKSKTSKIMINTNKTNSSITNNKPEIIKSRNRKRKPVFMRKMIEKEEKIFVQK